MLRINLLPSQEKKSLKLADLNKMVVSLMTRIAAILLIGMFLLVNTYFCLYIMLKDQTRLIDVRSNDAKIQALVDLEKVIKEDNRKLEQVLVKQDESILWTPILEELSKITAQGVYLTSLSYQKSLGYIHITGWANTRDGLLVFEEALEANPLFSEIEAPLSNLIKQNDITFTFSLRSTAIDKANEEVDQE